MNNADSQKVLRLKNLCKIEFIKNGRLTDIDNPAIPEEDLQHARIPLSELELRTPICVIYAYPAYASACLVAQAVKIFGVVAVYDDKFQAGVVVWSLSDLFKIGELIPINKISQAQTKITIN
jgi:hypothetical protein